MQATKKKGITSVIDYYHKKGYKTMDVTDRMNLNTYSKYATIAKKHPKFVVFFEKIPTNRIIFEMVGSTEDCNYFFMNKDNYLRTVIDNTISQLDADLKRCLNNFLEISDDLKCMICFEKDKQEFGKASATCHHCFFRMCHKCVDNLSEQELKKITDNEKEQILCPQCRQDLKLELKCRLLVIQ